MKTFTRFIGGIFFATVSLIPALSQTKCYNLAIENGTLGSWTGKTGSCCPVALSGSGIVDGRQTVLSDTTLKDANTGYQLRMIPAQSKYAIRLGNESNGNLAESLRYELVVENANALISVRYAMVVNGTNTDKAQFRISIQNEKGEIPDNCLIHYGLTATNSGSFSRYGNALWKDWETVYFDLSKYIGQTVTLDLQTNGNGTAAADYCYVYAIPGCQPLEIETTFCENDNSATLEAPPGFELYNWSTGQTGRVVTIVNPQEGRIYSCNMKNANGCESTVSTTIKRTIVNPQFSYEVIGCDSKIVQFYDVSSASNASVSAYNWDFGDGKYSNEKSPLHQYDNFGGYNVKLSVKTTPAACSESIVKQVYIYSTPQVYITGDNQICEGSTITLLASGADRYRWNTGDTTAAITITRGGTYEVTGFYNKGCPFGNLASITVIEKPSPVVTINGPGSFCSGLTAQLTASGAESYYWSTGESTPTITVFRGGNYSVSGSIGNGCTASASFSIQETDLPLVLFGNKNFCTGGFSELTITGADFYEWSTGVTGPKARFDKSGLYTVTGISAAGCRKTISFEIAEVGYPTVTIDGQNSFCQNSSTTLTARGAASYIWSNGARTSSINVITPGKYQVIGFNAIGLCSDTAVTNVVEYPLPDIRISGSLSFCEGDSTTLFASGGSSYKWSNGTTGQSITVKEEGLYSVTGISDKGCSKTTQVQVAKEIVPLIINGSLYFCSGDSTQIFASGANQYEWSTGQTGSTVFIKKAGTYTVTGTSISGCKKSVTFRIRESGPPTISVIGKTELCKGSYTTLTAVGALNFKWSTGETGATIRAYRGGTYRVWGYNETNCTGEAQITLSENELPQLSIDGRTEFCEGSSTRLTANGALTYIWNTGEITPTITVRESGYYTATGTNSAGCSSSYTVYVSERKINLQINQTTSTNFTLCSGDSLILIASGANTYEWSFGGNTDRSVIRVPGTYTLRGYNELGCSKTITFTVKQLPQVPLLLQGTYNICKGEVASLTASGANEYLWSTGETGNTITLTKEGNYSVTGFQEGFCSTKTDFAIREKPFPVLLIAGNTDICSGEKTTLTASGALSYRWNTGEVGPAIVVSQSGKYTVYGNTDGCESSASVDVTTRPMPRVSVEGTRSFCTGDSTRLTALGAERYIWSTGATGAVTYINKAGNYSVTGINGDHCAETRSFDISEIPSPNITISGIAEFCPGDSVWLTAQGGERYVWNTGATNASVRVNKSGIYTVVGFNATGCSGTATLSVRAPGESLKINGITEFCTGDSTRLTATGADHYLWSTGATTPAIWIGKTGNYTLSGYSGNGCSKTIPFEVKLSAIPLLSISGNDSLCAGETTTLRANGAYKYLWSTGDTARSILVSTPGIYKLTGYSPGGCPSEISFQVAEKSGPKLIITGPTMLCDDETSWLSARGFVSYLWSTGERDSTIRISKPGEYSVTGTTLTGCKSFGRITVSDRVVILGEQSFCAGDSTQLSASGGGKYQWNTGDTTATITVRKEGIYEVTATGKTGCLTRQAIYVRENEKPALDINGETFIQTGKTNRLEVSGASKYRWNTGDTTSFIFVNRGGIYSVTGTNASGCQSTQSVVITEYPLPRVSIRGKNSFCKGDSTSLLAVGATNYRWSTGENRSRISVKKAGIYSVIGSDDFGNQSYDTTTVREFGLPSSLIDAQPDIINARHRDVIFTSPQQTKVNYKWDTGDGYVSEQAEFSHSYTIGSNRYFDVRLTAVNQFGCQSISTQRILVDDFAPNTFTPNGDGHNDLFMSGYDIKIFSRKGILVFEGKTGWDGNYKGSKVPADTYFYIIRSDKPYSGKEYKTGYITVVH